MAKLMHQLKQKKKQNVKIKYIQQQMNNFTSDELLLSLLF